MTYILSYFLIVLLGLYNVNCQWEGTFIELLENVHGQSELLHGQMENVLTLVKDILNEQLTILSDNSLRNIINGIDQVSRIESRVNIMLLERTGLKCNEDIRSILDADVEEIGLAISECAGIADQAIQTLNENIFDILEEAQRNSTNVQSLVISHFITLDPEYPEGILTSVGNEIDAISSHFFSFTIPLLYQHLEEFAIGSVTIPNAVESCVADALADFNLKANKLFLQISTC